MTASQPFAHQADGGTAVAVCAHCGEEIRRCPGDAALPRWRDRADPQPPRCGFEDFVHASGERTGSHVCGKDGRLATPAGRP